MITLALMIGATWAPESAHRPVLSDQSLADVAGVANAPTFPRSQNPLYPAAMTSTACPVCRSRDTAALDARVEVPVLMNRLYATPDAARSASLGPLELVRCRGCGFVWNSAFRPELIAYDGDYENDQTHSAVFASHFRERAQAVVAAAPAGGCVDYLEIGCGQGRFLEEVLSLAGDRLGAAEGFDPAWRGADGAGPDGGPGGARIHKCYFDAATAGLMQRAPNLVVSRHTIEHVPDPVGFLTAIRAALGPESQARVFIETPCVDWIFEHQAMQDFFYEHCSLFTAGSLALALRTAGFHAPKVSHVFGGQYLWAEASTAGEDQAATAPADAVDAALDGAHERFTSHWREAVRAAAAEGPVALWGAGAKGVTFALMVDPDSRMLDHVVDINPGKQGRFFPASALPVLSPEASAARDPATIFVMNPNYLDEIAASLAARGLAPRLVAIN
jgi:SAM-dependent methyltransferase